MNAKIPQNFALYFSHVIITKGKLDLNVTKVNVKRTVQAAEKENNFPLHKTYCFLSYQLPAIIFSCLFQIHGTSRQKDRIYREDIYYGQGKALADATQDEIQDDIGERRDENPLAYDDNKLVFDLTESDLKKIQ